MLQDSHNGSKKGSSENPPSKATLDWIRLISGIKGATGAIPKFFTLQELLIKNFRSRIVAAVLDKECPNFKVKAVK